MTKKGLAATLGVIMMCSLAACGGKDEAGTTQGAETTSAPVETVEMDRSDVGEIETAPEMPEYVSVFDLGDISDYVELGEYKGIEVTARDTEVTDEEVEEELNAQMEMAGPLYEKVTEGTVAEGDVANIDFEGKMDGEVFQGGTGSGFNLTIGSGQFIPGFEDGLIGKKIGDTVVLDLNFPEDYTVNPDFSGKPVEFTVTINYVQGEELPRELNDAFIEDMTYGQFKTVDEYRKYMKAEMAEGKVEDARIGKITDAWEKIEANATFKKDAEELVQYAYDSQIYQLESMMSAYGMDIDGYLSAMGMTQEQLHEELTEYAEQNARDQLMMRAIIEAENLDLTDEEYEAGLKQLEEETGLSVDTLKEEYPEAMLRDILRQEAVQDFLEGTIVEIPAETEAEN